VLSGDQLYNIDFNEMLQFAIQKDADLTIATLKILEKDTSRFGLLKMDNQSEIVDFIEKPKEKYILDAFKVDEKLSLNNASTYLASMGIYVFKRKALEILLQEKGDDFGKNLIPIQLQKGKTFAYVHSGYWEDIGTIESYYNANKALVSSVKTLETYDEFHPIYSKKNNLPGSKINNTLLESSIICEGSVIEAKKIINSVIGLRSVIQKGTVISDSIIMGNNDYFHDKFTIGKNCFIKKAIIDENVILGNNVKLINKQNLSSYDGDGIYVRDGIIIVTRALEDNFEF
jgi:glucose-1-phosphate adenylyltransferase